MTKVDVADLAKKKLLPQHKPQIDNREDWVDEDPHLPRSTHGPIEASSCSHITAAFSKVTRKLSSFSALLTMHFSLLKVYQDKVGSTITLEEKGKHSSISVVNHTISVAILMHKFQI